MGRQTKIVPEFMIKHPNDTFRIILPLNLKLDYENYGNSHFNVIIKNETTEKHFLYEMAPELLFTHFSVEKYYLNAQENKHRYTKGIYKNSFQINTNVHYEFSDVKLFELLDEKNIVSLLGWKRKFLPNAKYMHCYYLKSNDQHIIIPHYAIAIYYYYRFTQMRESALNSKLEDLFVSCDNDNGDATIILKEKRYDVDAAFIHRYVSNDTARKAFDDVGLLIFYF